MRRSFTVVPVVLVFAASACTSKPAAVSTLSSVSSGAAASGSPSGTATAPSTSGTSAAGGPSTNDLASVIHTAASTSAGKGSARLTMSMDLGGQGTMTMSGVERWKGGLAADLTAAVSAGGQKITMRELIAPDAIYLKLSGAAAARLPKPWLKMSFKDVSKMSGINLDQVLSQARQSDPSKQLDLLAASGDITEIGQESVDGADVTHYRGSANLKKLAGAAGVDAAFVAELAKSGITSIDYDIWINADKLPVKLVEHMTVQGKATTMTINLSDYGVPVTLKLPAASQVTDLAKALGKTA